MNFKKVRYNLLVIGLIALVGCYIGLSFFISQPNNSGTNAGGDGNNVILPIDPDDEGDDPFFSDNDDDYVDGSDQNQTEVPSAPLDLVIYGLNMLNEAKSYNSTFDSAVVNTASIMDVGATQHIVGKVDKGVNSKGEKVAIEENYYYSFDSGLAAGFVARYFKGLYTNESTGKTQVVISNNYNYNDKTYSLTGASRNEVLDTSKVIEEFKLLQGQDFPIKITSSTAKVTKDIVSPLNKSCKEITVTLKSLSSLSENFVDYYASSGQLKNVKYRSISITFTISQRTGKIKQITRKEELTADVVGMAASVTSVITTNQYFSNINNDILLKDSL